MESLFTLLFLLALWLLPKIIGNVVKREDPKVMPPINEEMEEQEEYFTPEPEVQNLRETVVNSPKESDYFTYENESLETSPLLENGEIYKGDISQVTDTEEVKTPSLQMDQEEIYKGVIYSEILKKKF